MSYQWLYPKNGGFAIYRHVDDYDATRAAGFSIYPDFRDLSEAENLVPAAEFVCDICGAGFSSRIAMAGHKRSHK